MRVLVGVSAESQDTRLIQDRKEEEKEEEREREKAK